MSNIYYKIWADAIVHEQAKKDRESNWKAFTLIPISLLQGINLFSLLLLLRLLSHGQFLIIFPMSIFNNVGFNIAISLLLTYLLPFVIINYLLIFYNDRYKRLINVYDDEKGKLYGKYALISVGIIVVPLLFKVIFL